MLELERNRVSRSIEFRNGWIGACSSDDPPNRLGQFLLARGKITEEKLRKALAEQEQTGENLGVILTRMGVLTQTELMRQVTAKAEETIQGLFDWDDAVFRFQEGATLDPNQIAVSLSVREVLMRGIQHHDELQRIRETFKSSGVVLKRTELPAPANLLNRPMAARIFDSVDGERSLAEVLLHAHASEFLVLKLLFRLYQLRLVEIHEQRPASPDSRTLLDVEAADAGPRSPGQLASEVEQTLQRDVRAAGLNAAEDGGSPEDSGGEPAQNSKDDLDSEVTVAGRLMSRGEYAAALELLNASYRAHPGESHLTRLIAKAEAGYVETVRKDELSSSKVPVLRGTVESLREQQLGPEESFLVTLIDGESDIKSIIWLAPLREVDALRTLRLMVDRGLIELLEPEQAKAREAGATETA
jgi:hypothetical protein